MTEQLPAWATSVFGVGFVLVLAVVAWTVKSLAGRVHSDIANLGKKVDRQTEKVNAIGERLVRVETLLNGGSRRPPTAPPVYPPPNRPI